MTVAVAMRPISAPVLLAVPLAVRQQRNQYALTWLCDARRCPGCSGPDTKTGGARVPVALAKCTFSEGTDYAGGDIRELHTDSKVSELGRHVSLQ